MINFYCHRINEGCFKIETEYSSFCKEIISGRNAYIYNYNETQMEPETQIAASYQTLCFHQLVFM